MLVYCMSGRLPANLFFLWKLYFFWVLYLTWLQEPELPAGGAPSAPTFGGHCVSHGFPGTVGNDANNSFMERSFRNAPLRKSTMWTNQYIQTTHYHHHGEITSNTKNYFIKNIKILNINNGKIVGTFFIKSYKTNTKPHRILDQFHYKLKKFAIKQ